MVRSKSQFRVGDRVVCINDRYSVTDPKYMFMSFPKKGKTYTVRGFCSMGSSMHLEEIRNEPLPGRTEIWFYNWRFTKKVNPKAKIKITKKKIEELI